MTNLDKSEKFDRISDSFKNEADITCIGVLSFKIAIPCGCYQVQHLLDMGKEYDSLTNKGRTAESISIRSQFFSFCRQHK